MEKGSFDGEMDRIITANTIEDKDMVRADSCGQMEKLMTGIMWMINEPEKEYTAGQTVRFTKVHFSKVKTRQRYFHSSDGIRYEGEWLNDLQHGKGKLFFQMVMRSSEPG